MTRNYPYPPPHLKSDTLEYSRQLKSNDKSEVLSKALTDKNTCSCFRKYIDKSPNVTRNHELN
ncbi:MAG: hypothetical protein OEQ94_00745 [Nitrosopumilus sp.]|nr:hypothetical protein [Nitrosopumilus sp.]MDH3822269.1 hypothetical protein [Nitrosopumilus sp.]